MTNNKITIRSNDRVNDKRESCSDFTLRILKKANQALTYLDFGSTFDYGTLRNTLSKLMKHGKVLKIPEESPARFILREWAHRPEYSCIIRNDKRGRVGKFDFLSYLESLGWSSKLCVHDLRLTFQVYQLQWLSREWEYCKSSKSYKRSLSVSYPVSAQCFDTGTVLISIGCSVRPFPLDVDGLTALSNLLGEIRNALYVPCIPEPASWLIAQWHLNRDSEKMQGGGLDIYLTFRDFFNDSAQIYYKHSLDKVRAEVNQSPKQTIREVFERILNRDSSQEGAK